MLIFQWNRVEDEFVVWHIEDKGVDKELIIFKREAFRSVESDLLFIILQQRWEILTFWCKLFPTDHSWEIHDFQWTSHIIVDKLETFLNLKQLQIQHILIESVIQILRLAWTHISLQILNKFVIGNCWISSWSRC